MHTISSLRKVSRHCARLLWMAGALALLQPAAHARDSELPDCNLNSKSGHNRKACEEWRRAAAGSGSPQKPVEMPGGLQAKLKP